MGEPNRSAFEGEGLGSFFKKKQMLGAAGGAGARVAAPNGASLNVRLELLDDNPYQPRGAMDEGALEELAAGIARNGLLQSITVRRAGDRFQIIAGHRRVAAYRLLKERVGDGEKATYAAIPSQEKLEVTDEQMAVYALIENLQRVDLDAVEAAAGLARYREAESLSAQELAERTGLDIRRLRRLLQLNAAPEVVKAGVSRGVLVPVLDASGEQLTTASGKERQERRTLDLMGAIEVERLYRHWAKDDEKKAAARADVLVRRILTEAWPLRRIQAHCQSAIKGIGGSGQVAGAGSGASSVSEGRAPLFDDGPRRLSIFKDRISSATGDERIALAKVLSGLVKELG